MSDVLRTEEVPNNYLGITLVYRIVIEFEIHVVTCDQKIHVRNESL